MAATKESVDERIIELKKQLSSEEAADVCADRGVCGAYEGAADCGQCGRCGGVAGEGESGV